MSNAIFEKYFKTIDFDCLTVSITPRSDSVGNIVRVNINKRIDISKLKDHPKSTFFPHIKQVLTYPYIKPLVIFWVDYFTKGYHLYFGFDNTILGKRTRGQYNNSLSDNKSCRIVKKFDEQTCFMIICMALFIGFNESLDFDVFGLTGIKRFPDWRSIKLPEKYLDIFNAIKNEFTLSLNQSVVQSLDRIRKEFHILHKYDVPLDRVTQVWNETLVMDVMDK